MSPSSRAVSIFNEMSRRWSPERHASSSCSRSAAFGERWASVMGEQGTSARPTSRIDIGVIQARSCPFTYEALQHRHRYSVSERRSRRSLAAVHENVGGFFVKERLLQWPIESE